MVWSTAADAHGQELLALDEQALCVSVAEAGTRSAWGLSLLTPAVGFPLS